MFCPKCGHGVEDDALYCRSCGASLATSPSPLSTPAVASTIVRDPALATGARTGVLNSNVTGFEALQAGPVEYAGFWRRFAAVIVDTILVTILSALIGFVIGLVLGAARVPTSEIQGFGSLVGLLIGILYYPVQECSGAQATWGKRALNIMVTDVDGRRISFWRALGRNLGKFISAIPLCFGYLMAAFTQHKQALHDMMAGTLVVVGKPEN